MQSDEQTQRLTQKLARELGPIVGPALKEEGVVEIVLNPDGRVWVEKLGGTFEERGAMTAATAEALMGTIASCLRTTVTRENPILEGELPLDGSRFEGLLPPIVANPAFAIRRKAAKVFTLADYVEAGIMSAAQRAQIVAAVRARQNILVVGGTGTGKTTLSNAIIHAITEHCPDDRLVYIEDTAELQCTARNAVGLHASDRADMLRLLRATLRLKPDRIIVGETRGAECLALLKAWNTGHPGGIATVHANDAHAGLIRIEQLVAEATPTPMPALIAAAVNLIVVIVKDPASGRRIAEMLRVDGFDRHTGTYRTTPISQPESHP